MDYRDVVWLSLCADVPEPLVERAADYWQAITAATVGPPLGEHEQFLPLQPPHGDRVLLVQAVPRDVAGWHPDLHSTDPAATVDRAEGLGAELIATHEHWTVLLSPGGLPFCVTAAARGFAVPPAVAWAGGRSALDQLCLDIPAEHLDAEAAFWAGLTGWPLRPDDRPEFTHLDPPASVAVRVLAQRLDADDPHGMRAHPDLAADDRAAEVARHVEAGGRVVRETDGWTTLQDPAGLLYCVTDRTPRG